MIVGDPNQLAPVVTLDARTVSRIAQASGVRQEDLRKRHLAYGQDSAYTAFEARVEAPLLLAEHYRCHPHIAAWFNEHFYQGRLEILTDVSQQQGGIRGLHWEQVRGRTEPGHAGSAINQAEAEAVVAWVLDHIGEEGTLGVVTPFTAQADLIDRLLRRALREHEYESRKITVGTAHRFQGGECDVVLFSTVLSNGAQPRTATWLQKESNLINVAVSRARRALIVSATPRRRPPSTSPC
jgi:superfamily I DNA and/or RNA helicase